MYVCLLYGVAREALHLVEEAGCFVEDDEEGHGLVVLAVLEYFGGGLAVDFVDGTL